MAKQVRDLMSRPVKTLGRNDKLSMAKEVMNAERIRHLPVVEDDEAWLASSASATSFSTHWFAPSASGRRPKAECSKGCL